MIFFCRYCGHKVTPYWVLGRLRWYLPENGSLTCPAGTGRMYHYPDSGWTRQVKAAQRALIALLETE